MYKIQPNSFQEATLSYSLPELSKFSRIALSFPLWSTAGRHCYRNREVGICVKQLYCLGAKIKQEVLQTLLKDNGWSFDLHLQVKSEQVRHLDTNPSLKNLEEEQAD